MVFMYCLIIFSSSAMLITMLMLFRPILSPTSFLFRFARHTTIASSFAFLPLLGGPPPPPLEGRRPAARGRGLSGSQTVHSVACGAQHRTRGERQALPPRQRAHKADSRARPVARRASTWGRRGSRKMRPCRRTRTGMIFSPCGFAARHIGTFTHNKMVKMPTGAISKQHDDGARATASGRCRPHHRRVGRAPPHRHGQERAG